MVTRRLFPKVVPCEAASSKRSFNLCHFFLLRFLTASPSCGVLHWGGTGRGLGVASPAEVCCFSIQSPGLSPTENNVQVPRGPETCLQRISHHPLVACSVHLTHAVPLLGPLTFHLFALLPTSCPQKHPPPLGYITPLLLPHVFSPSLRHWTCIQCPFYSHGTLNFHKCTRVSFCCLLPNGSNLHQTVMLVTVRCSR